MSEETGRTILLVEDEAIIALSEKMLLERHGYTVETVTSGEGAVDMIEENDGFDLVLMDIDLGHGITGDVAAERILEIRHLPIVFLTSHTERDFVERVKGITRYGYVVKHSGEFVLIESVAMALELFKAHQETREREKRIAEINRTYQVLSDVNQTIVRATRGRNLLEEICRIAVEKGDFRFAWICAPDESGNALERVHFWGEGKGPEVPVHIDLTGEVARRGPTARAYSSGTAVVIDDLLDEPEGAAWREFGYQYGVRSIAAFPIRRAGVVAYVLTLYSPVARFFDGREMELLSELIMDVEYALAGIDTEAKRVQAEAERAEWQELMDYVVRHDPNAITVLDRELRHIYVSDRFCRDYRVERESVLGRPHYEVFPEVPERWRKVHARALAGEVLRSEDDYFVRADGSVDYTRWECRPWYRGEEIGGIILYTEVVNAVREAEGQKRAALSAMEALLANSPHLVSILDAEGVYWMVSDSVAEVIGVPKKEITGHILEDLLPREVAREFREAIETVVASGERVLKRDDLQINGRKARFETTLFPAQKVDGNVTLIGVMSVAS
ncbi:MAG: PAS domain-containing protein [Spirochaetaceae bacterium]